MAFQPGVETHDSLCPRRARTLQALEECQLLLLPHRLPVRTGAHGQPRDASHRRIRGRCLHRLRGRGGGGWWHGWGHGCWATPARTWAGTCWGGSRHAQPHIYHGLVHVSHVLQTTRGAVCHVDAMRASAREGAHEHPAKKVCCRGICASQAVCDSSGCRCGMKCLYSLRGLDQISNTLDPPTAPAASLLEFHLPHTSVTPTLPFAPISHPLALLVAHALHGLLVLCHLSLHDVLDLGDLGIPTQAKFCRHRCMQRAWAHVCTHRCVLAALAVLTVCNQVTAGGYSWWFGQRGWT